MHRDIKPGNILISNNGIIKLSDFGVSADLIESGILNKTRNTMVGTLDYMSDQIINPLKKYTKKADIYALGITTFELFLNKSGKQYRQLISEQKFDDMWKQSMLSNLNTIFIKNKKTK